jgi:hypothetical protein
LAETVEPNLDNMTIILELAKFFGREMNLVVTFDTFKAINQKATTVSGKPRGYLPNEMRIMFSVALNNLKYMGFIS